MKDKPTPFAELFGSTLQNLGDAIIQSIDEALLASRGPAALDIPAVDRDAQRFARAHGIDIAIGPDLARSPEAHNLARAYDPATSPCIDSGRCLEQIPAFVLTPSDRGALTTCVAYVRQRGLALALRGAGLSSGGQTLAAHGAVIDTRKLSRIELDAQDPSAVRVEAGARWESLLETLSPGDRRPVVVPLHVGASLGGTLAAGGFGDTSHRYGLVAHHVRKLELLTGDDATPCEVAPGDARFDEAIGGGGDAIIAAATLALVERPPMLTGASAGWESLAHFVDDAISLIEDEPQLDVLLARRMFDAEFPVVGTIGRQQREPGLDLGALRDLNAEIESVSQRDALELARERFAWLPAELCAPALELSLPLPGGLRAMKRIERHLEAARLLHAMPRGAWLFVTRGGTAHAPRLSHVALPDAEHVLHVQLRPLVRQHRVRAVLRVLAAIAGEVAAVGGLLQSSGCQALFAQLHAGRVAP